MNTIKNKRRVINILKSDFDVIKKYCDDNALKMPKWLVKIALKEINQTQKEEN